MLDEENDMTTYEIKQLIEKAIPGAIAQVEGEDGVHFQAVVISAAFRELSPVKKHQLVYQALGERMHTEIHALSIKALTPEEWNSANDHAN
jgi:acid stress-induced BolA-like protein IbaG/YrbA